MIKLQISNNFFKNGFCMSHINIMHTNFNVIHTYNTFMNSIGNIFLPIKNIYYTLDIKYDNIHNCHTISLVEILILPYYALDILILTEKCQYFQNLHLRRSYTTKNFSYHLNFFVIDFARTQNKHI